jgi:repressor of nif and glnA expression
MSFEIANTERKILSILKALNSVQHPMGSHRISQHLNNNEGLVLSEGTVRYHLMLMDIRGLTELVRNREGRIITDKGRNELKKAEVR